MFQKFYKSLILVARFFYDKFLKPKSRNDDLKRKEFILNILLGSIIFLLGIFSFFIVGRYLEEKGNFNGIPLVYFFSILGFFIILYLLSRCRLFVLSSYFFIGVLFLSITGGVYYWGIDLPQVLLSYALVIVMSGVLVDTAFAFFITLAISVSLIVIGYLQINNIIFVNSYWRYEFATMSNAIEFSITLLVIAVVSWLSNREIEKSLKRAKRSEKELKEERDSLEIKVEKRTKELQKAQIEKVRQLYRFAEFGRLSSGLFHDLSNHLTALFLNLEMADPKKQKEAGKTKEYLEEARIIMNQTEDFIEAMQKQLRREGNLKVFSLNKEIEHVIQIFGYKMNQEKIRLEFVAESEVIMFGSLIGFNQIVTNLLSNAVDACSRVDEARESRFIEIRIGQTKEKAILIVKDSGCGIKKELNEKIFDPFFTTKEIGKGTGIGLSSTKKIVEKDFGGVIHFKSQVGEGTVFTVELPIKK